MILIDENPRPNLYAFFRQCKDFCEEEPDCIRQRIAEFSNLNDSDRLTLLQWCVLENYRLNRQAYYNFYIEKQLDRFPEFQGDFETIRRLIEIDLQTAEAAISREGLKERFPSHAGAIDELFEFYGKNGITSFTTAIRQIPETDVPRRQDEQIPLSDRYAIEEHLGRGGIKDVYRVEQQSTGQQLVLKELTPQRQEFREFHGMLKNEAILQSTLRHQGVPPIYSLQDNDSVSPILLERLIHGKPWSLLIDDLSLEENLDILLQVAKIIAFAHKERHIIHADLKPENVMVDRQYGETYVVDWGLAIDLKSPEVEAGTISYPLGGTDVYRAPESLSRKYGPLGTTLDVFQLGAVLYRILTGKAPYEEAMWSFGLYKAYAFICRVEMTPPEKAIPDGRTLSWELCELAKTALAPDPAKRFTDAEEFADALQRYQHRSETLKHYEKAEQQYRDFDEGQARVDGSSNSLQIDVVKLIEFANEFKGIRESLEKWTDSITEKLSLVDATDSEKNARLSLVDTALKLDDFGMAEGQLNLAETLATPPDQASIQERRKRIETGLAKRRWERRMKIVAAALVGIVLLALFSILFLQRQISEKNAENERQQFTIFRQETEAKQLRVIPLIQNGLTAERQGFEQGAGLFFAHAMAVDENNENARLRYLASRQLGAYPTSLKRTDLSVDDLTKPTSKVDRVQRIKAISLPKTNEMLLPSLDDQSILHTISTETVGVTGRYTATDSSNDSKTAVLALSASPDASHFATLMKNGDLYVWKRGETTPMRVVKKSIRPVMETMFGESIPREEIFSFSGDNKLLLFADIHFTKSAVLIYDLEKEDPPRPLSFTIPKEQGKGHKFGPAGVFFVPGDKEILVLWQDYVLPHYQVISWWNPENGECLQWMPCWEGPMFKNRMEGTMFDLSAGIAPHAISRDRKHLVLSNIFGDVALYDVVNRRVLWQKILDGEVLENYATWSTVTKPEETRLADMLEKSERSLPPVVQGLDFSSDASRFAATFHNGIVRVFDTKSGKTSQTFGGLQPRLEIDAMPDTGGLLTIIAPKTIFRPYWTHGDSLAILGSDGMLVRWNSLHEERQDRLFSQPNIEDRQTGGIVRVAPNDEQWCELSNGRLRCWRKNETEPLISSGSWNQKVRDVAYFMDEKGSLKLAVSASSRLVIVDATTGQEIAELGFPEMESVPSPESLLLRYDSSQSGLAQQAIQEAGDLRKKAENEEAARDFFGLSIKDDIAQQTLMFSRIEKYSCLAVSRSLLATLGGSGDIQVWDLKTLKQTGTLKISDVPLRAIAFRQDGKQLAVADESGELFLVDTAPTLKLHEKKEKDPLRLSLNPAAGLLYLPDGMLVQHGRGNRILLWDTNEGRVVQRLETEQSFTDLESIEAVAASPDGRLLFAGNNRGTIFCWERPDNNERFVVRTLFAALPTEVFRQQSEGRPIRGLGVSVDRSELLVSLANNVRGVDVDSILSDIPRFSEEELRELERKLGITLDEKKGVITPIVSKK